MSSIKDPILRKKYERQRYLDNRDNFLKYARTYCKKNKEKIKAAHKNWQKSKGDNLRNYYKNYKLKSVYGISLLEYNQMVENQLGVCWICKNPPGKKALYVDHNHSTGEVRGLLCALCNVIVGSCHEEVDVLKCAIKYLRTFNKRKKAHGNTYSQNSSETQAANSEGVHNEETTEGVPKG